MKKIIFYSIALSSVSFSFHKFSTPYVVKGRAVVPMLISIGQPIKLNNRNTKHQFNDLYFGETDLSQPVIHLKYLNYNEIDLFDVIVAFEPITKSCIATSPYSYNMYKENNNFYYETNNNNPIEKFLFCNINYDAEKFWKFNNLVNYESFTSGKNWGPLIYTQNKYNNYTLDDNLKSISSAIHNINKNRNTMYQTFYASETAKKEHGINYVQKSDDLLPKNSLNIIRLQRKIILANDTIDVINEKEGVKLYKRKGEKVIAEVDLKQALLDYYSPDKTQTDFAQKLHQDLKDFQKDPKKPTLKSDTIALAATQSFHPKLKKEAYDLLSKSKIDAVWYVKAELFDPIRYFTQEERDKSYYFKRGVYTVIIGLAHNDQDGYFHWATDLGRDIEVLFPIQSAFSKKSVDQSTTTEPEIENNKRKRDEDQTDQNNKKIKIENLTY